MPWPRPMNELQEELIERSRFEIERIGDSKSRLYTSVDVESIEQVERIQELHAF